MRELAPIGPVFTVYGPPRTKKNSLRRKRRGNRTFTVPSEAFCAWESRARLSLPAVRRGFENAGVSLPITDALNCDIQVYLEVFNGDPVGFYQGFADWLQKVGIIANDAQVRSWDGSWLHKDADRPRIECQLAVVEDTEFARVMAARARRKPRAPRKRALKGKGVVKHG